MYGSHYSDKPWKVRGDEWEEQTFQLLKKVARWLVPKMVKNGFYSSFVYWSLI